MGRHTTGQFLSGRRRSVATIGLVTLVSLSLLTYVVWGLFANRGSTAAEADNDGAGFTAAESVDALDYLCPETSDEPISVWAAPSIEPAILFLLERVEKCGDYEVQAMTSEAAFDSIANGDDKPNVWIPDSLLWSQAVLATDKTAIERSVLATTPVVLAAPKKFGEKALPDAGHMASLPWSDVVGESDFSLNVSDPTQDPASLALVATIDGALTEGGAKGTDRDSQVFQLAQNALEETPQEALRDSRETYVPVTEQFLILEPELAEKSSLLNIDEGAGVISYPMVTFEREDLPINVMSQAFTDARANQGWDDAGLRPGTNGSAPSGMVSDAEITVGPSPGPEDLATLVGKWRNALPDRQLLALIDVSGSMDTEVGAKNETRMEITSASAISALKTLPAETRFGLRWFSTNRGPGGQDWQEQEPLEALSTKIGKETHRDRLITSIKGADTDFTKGDTGLYDSVVEGYESLNRSYDPDYRSVLVVLTDGTNDDSTGGRSEGRAVAELTDTRDEQKPVELVLIGIGPDVAAAPMERLAKSVGGQYLQVDDEADMKDAIVQVFVN